MKEYKKIEFNCGCSITEAVLELVEYAAKGKFVCGDFNGNTLYSDTVSMDSAYKTINGLTMYESMEKTKKWKENYEEQQLEHKNSIPKLEKEWIEKGHSILSEDKWELWDKCVPVRLNDLYQGMELGNCIEIIEILNKGSFEDAKLAMENQGHSGMSWGLVKAMIRSFSDKGEKFAEYLT